MNYDMRGTIESNLKNGLWLDGHAEKCVSVILQAGDFTHDDVLNGISYEPVAGNARAFRVTAHQVTLLARYEHGIVDGALPGLYGRFRMVREASEKEDEETFLEIVFNRQGGLYLGGESLNLKEEDRQKGIVRREISYHILEKVQATLPKIDRPY